MANGRRTTADGEGGYLERPSTRPQAACSGNGEPASATGSENGETCVSDRLSERNADQLIIVNVLTSISPAWPSTVALNVTV